MWIFWWVSKVIIMFLFIVETYGFLGDRVKMETYWAQQRSWKIRTSAFGPPKRDPKCRWDFLATAQLYCPEARYLNLKSFLTPDPWAFWSQWLIQTSLCFQVLLTGGFDGDDYVKKTWEYDFNTEEWTTKSWSETPVRHSGMLLILWTNYHICTTNYHFT